MSQKIEQDMKRIQEAVDRMGTKAEAKGKEIFSSLIGHFADLVEGIEKTVSPDAKKNEKK